MGMLALKTIASFENSGDRQICKTIHKTHEGSHHTIIASAFPSALARFTDLHLFLG